MKNKVIENLIQMYKLPSVMLVVIIIMFRFYFYAKKNNIDEDFGIFFLEAKLSLHVVISENKKIMNALLLVTSTIIYYSLYLILK